MHGWMAMVDDVMAFLIARGYRPTPQRYAVVAYLVEHETLEPDAVTRVLRVAMPGMTRATVRRVADLLERVGVVRMDAGDGALYRLVPAGLWGEVTAGAA